MVLPLGIASEHLDDEIVQTIVELFLKSPGKLSVFDLARPKQKNICVNLRLCGCGLYLFTLRSEGEPASGRSIANFDFDTFRSRASAKGKQREFVPGKFGAHFFSESAPVLPPACQ